LRSGFDVTQASGVPNRANQVFASASPIPHQSGRLLRKPGPCTESHKSDPAQLQLSEIAPFPGSRKSRVITVIMGMIFANYYL
jgi:hypothetical protein